MFHLHPDFNQESVSVWKILKRTPYPAVRATGTHQSLPLRIMRFQLGSTVSLEGRCWLLYAFYAHLPYCTGCSISGHRLCDHLSKLSREPPASGFAGLTANGLNSTLPEDAMSSILTHLAFQISVINGAISNPVTFHFCLTRE